MAGRRLLNEDNKFDDINKSKLTKTQVFDMNGETLTEKNIDNDGIETTTVKKTPASYFDDQRLNGVFNLLGVGNAMASEEYTPPSETPSSETFVSSDVAAAPLMMAPNFGVTNPHMSALSPLASARGEHVNKMERYTEAAKILEAQKLKDGYPNERLAEKLLTWVHELPDTFDTYSDEEVIAATPEWDTLTAPYEPANITSITDHHAEVAAVLGADASQPEIELANEVASESGLPIEIILQDPDAMLRIKEQAEVERVAAEAEAARIAAEANPEETILADTSELLDNLDESAEKYSSPSKPHDGELNYNVEAAVQEIVNQDPTAIEELNNFATWAEGVSDEESQAAAKEYLDELAVQPSVNDRFKKAMAIAFAAMLFGDDIGTAMNTGFGVVADDYAREDLEQEAINTANAKAVEDQNKAARDLAKTIATEERALGRALKKEERDLIKQLELEKRNLNKTLNAEGRSTELWADKLIITTDIAHQKLLAELDRTASKETLAEAKRLTTDNYAFIKDRADNKWASLSPKAQEKFDNNNNFRMQMDGGLGWMVRNSTKVVDFENNVDQRNAFENSYAKWMHDSQRFDAPNFDTYIQDEFIKNKFMGAGEILNEKTYIEPSLISPTLESLRNDGWSGENIQWSKSHEQVANLYEKVQQIIPTIGTEKHTLMLLKKDFNDFKNFDSEGNKVPDGENSKRYNTLAKKSAKNGIGVFTRFVNQMSPASLWGMVYDPAGKGKSVKWKQDATAQYLLPTTE